jgi:hypothetical protein
VTSNLFELRFSGDAEASAARHGIDDELFDALHRVRSYQQDIDRASAILCEIHPELIASEVVPLREAEPQRPRWPLILAIGASCLFWTGFFWALANLL